MCIETIPIYKYLVCKTLSKGGFATRIQNFITVLLNFNIFCPIYLPPILFFELHYVQNSVDYNTKPYTVKIRLAVFPSPAGM